MALIRSQNVYNGEFYLGGLAHITDKQAEEMNGVSVLPEDVLLNITGDSVARCTVAPADVLPARVNQHVCIIRPDREKLLSKFLMYFLISPAMQSHMLSIAGSGGTRNALTKGMIEKFEVPTPSITEQQCITDVLSAYDDLIENNRRRIALLEQSARLLYREWFVHLRFPGHEHVKVVDGVPEGWAINSIAEMFDTTSGGTPSRSVPEYFVGDINWVKTQELDELFIFDTEEHISEAALKNSAAKLFPEGTLLVSIYGGTNIGRTGLLAKAAASNQACVALMPKRHPDDVLFAQKWLQENRGHVVGLGQGAAQTNISQQTLRSQKMLVPTVELLDEFVGAIKPMYQQIANICQQNAKLRDARDLLLPRLMSGDLVV
ncbi:restriction endonuclease subunit S [Thermomonas aquatica]|uniref:Restriction endonuclease subunit S n=1 Tax=Thermomonas aquatica TaxID=2202149 RepID=A0A5B7ZSC4_9GAMM|nr:restriction endonuclease subunit S [Thermomonas aquatica]QDA57677.1 restriction endonuclease subunit S [Thermomonas aquatica]